MKGTYSLERETFRKILYISLKFHLPCLMHPKWPCPNQKNVIIFAPQSVPGKTQVSIFHTNIEPILEKNYAIITLCIWTREFHVCTQSPSQTSSNTSFSNSAGFFLESSACRTLHQLATR